MVETTRADIERSLSGLKNYRVVIPQEIHSDLSVLVNSTKLEVGALASCSISDDGLIRVNEMFIPKQTISSGDVDFDQDGVDDVLLQCIGADKPLNCWIHSHANMGVFWSGTDQNTIGLLRGASDAPIVSIVVNHKQDILSRLDIPVTVGGSPVYIGLNKLPTEIETHVNEERKALIESLIERNVKQKVYQSVVQNGYGGYDRFGDMYGGVPTMAVMKKDLIDIGYVEAEVDRLSYVNLVAAWKKEFKTSKKKEDTRVAGKGKKDIEYAEKYREVLKFIGTEDINNIDAYEIRRIYDVIQDITEEGMQLALEVIDGGIKLPRTKLELVRDFMQTFTEKEKELLREAKKCQIS